jgi:hypothetical protein
VFLCVALPCARDAVPQLRACVLGFDGLIFGLKAFLTWTRNGRGFALGHEMPRASVCWALEAALFRLWPLQASSRRLSCAAGMLAGSALAAAACLLRLRRPCSKARTGQHLTPRACPPSAAHTCALVWHQ